LLVFVEGDSLSLSADTLSGLDFGFDFAAVDFAAASVLIVPVLEEPESSVATLLSDSLEFSTSVDSPTGFFLSRDGLPAMMLLTQA
jgi:hypothetical protein